MRIAWIRKTCEGPGDDADSSEPRDEGVEVQVEQQSRYTRLGTSRRIFGIRIHERVESVNCEVVGYCQAMTVSRVALREGLVPRSASTRHNKTGHGSGRSVTALGQVSCL